MRRFLRATLSTLFLLAEPPIVIAQDKPFVTTSPMPEYYAWWLRTEYHPFGPDIRGIPACRDGAMSSLIKEQRSWKVDAPADMSAIA
jgi:hypothetical protein